jgi:hypothetical protein
MFCATPQGSSLFFRRWPEGPHPEAGHQSVGRGEFLLYWYLKELFFSLTLQKWGAYCWEYEFVYDADVKACSEVFFDGHSHQYIIKLLNVLWDWIV